MSYRGASEIEWRRFGGGLVLDTDATELPDGYTPDCRNVDLSEETIAKRKGRSAYNATAPVVAPVIGLHRHYPPSGSPRFLVATETAIYEDNGAGGLAAVVTGLSAGATHRDFVAWRDVVYAGDGVNSVRKRSSGGAWSVVALPVAPGSAPTVGLRQTVLEAFDSGTWTVSGSALSTSYDTSIQVEGAACLKLAATGGGARGSSIDKAWSAGTQDLSQAEAILLWYYAEKIGITFQVGVKDNSGTLVWLATFATQQRETWAPIRVPLADIPPASRTASPGLGIRFVDKPSGVSFPVAIFLDRAMAAGPLEADRYVYTYTYAEVDANGVVLRESNPSPAASIDVGQLPPSLGVSVSVTASVETGINRIFVYRYRQRGPFRRARRVLEASNATATLLDTVADGTIALENRPEVVADKQAPPVARAYAVVNHRLVAADVTIGGTRYPDRVYLSRLGFPEEFGSSDYTHQPATDPTAPGWFRLPVADRILRILDFDGQAILFCERSIWTLQGSGWDDFSVQKRADVGLCARGAVAVTDRLIYFLDSVGEVRVLAPNRSFDGLFETWIVSEPVSRRLREIPAAARSLAAMGVDERGRVLLAYTRSGQTTNDACLVFDPKRPGALSPQENPLRPGWTWYDGIPARVFASLKRGGGDAGQLVFGDATTCKVWYLHRNASDAPIETDDGQAIPWRWTSPARDGGTQARLHVAYVRAEFDPSAGATVTADILLDRNEASPSSRMLTLSATAGIDALLSRVGLSVAGRYLQLRIGGTHSVAMTCRSLGLGLYRRR